MKRQSYTFKVGDATVVVKSNGDVIVEKGDTRLRISREESIDLCHGLLSYYAKDWKDDD